MKSEGSTLQKQLKIKIRKGFEGKNGAISP